MYVYKNKFTVIEKFSMVKVDEGIVIEFDLDELNEASDYHYGKKYGEFLVEAKELLEQFCKVTGTRRPDTVENDYVKFSIDDKYYVFHAHGSFSEILDGYGMTSYNLSGVDIVLDASKVLVSDGVIREFINVVQSSDVNHLR